MIELEPEPCSAKSPDTEAGMVRNTCRQPKLTISTLGWGMLAGGCYRGTPKAWLSVSAERCLSLA